MANIIVAQIAAASKRCCLCKSILPLSSFDKCKRNKSGIQTGCKSCARERTRKLRALQHTPGWRLLNADHVQAEKDKERERSRRRREIDSEGINRRAREQYAKNPGRQRARSRRKWELTSQARRDEKNARRREKAQENPEIRLAKRRERRIRNRDAQRQADRAWKQENKEKVSAQTAARRLVRRDELNAMQRARHHANPGKYNARTAKRAAFKKRALPAWADLLAIQEFYVEAARLTISTGVKHEVDHIVPLDSPLVCGLHVQSNLEVKTQRENRKKSNKF